MVDLIETFAKPDGGVLEVVCFDLVGQRLFVGLEKVSLENALFHFLAQHVREDVTVLVSVVVDSLKAEVLVVACGGSLHYI